MSLYKKYITKNIFISSTFVDMQVERDILSKKVLPLVKEFALKYYINIEFVDLRFGIDIGNKNLLDKVVNTCGDEIIRCKPLFIGFLGDRFGTEIKDSNESITSYEIHKAIEEKCESLYYFRNITNPNDLGDNLDKYYYKTDKVNNLKEELIKIYPNNCKEYNAVYDTNKNELDINDEFINMIVNDINNLIKRLYEDESINTLLPHYEYLSFLNKDYIDVDIVDKKAFDGLFNKEEKIVLIYGNSGCGKSLLLSNLLKDLEDILIIPFFVSASDDASLLNVINTYIEALYKHLDKDYEYILNEEEALNIFYECLSKLDKNTLIVLDEFEQIKDGINYDRYSWLKVDEIPSNVKFVMTTNFAYDVDKLELDSYIVRCNYVNESIVKTFLDIYLDRINQKVSKDFYDVLLKELLNKSIDKPIIYLKIYLEYIFYNDRHDASLINDLSNNDSDKSLSGVDKGVLDFYVDKIKNMDEKLSLLLPRLVNKKTELLDSELVNVIMAMLSISALGVRESDIYGVCKLLNIKYVSNEFAYLRKIMPSYFYQQKDGSWVFTHRLIKTNLNKHYMANDEYVDKVLDAFLTHLRSLDDGDEIKLANIIPLLYINEDYEEIKRILLFMIKENKTHFIEYFISNVFYHDRDYDFLLFLLDGYNEIDQEYITWFITNTLSASSIRELNIFAECIEIVSSRLNKSNKSLKYFFAKMTATLNIHLNQKDFSIVEPALYSLYYETNNPYVKNSILEMYFQIVKLVDGNTKTNIITNLTRLIKRSKDKNKEYYGNLTKVYLEYLKHNKANRKLINDHIKYVIKYINEGYADVKATGDFIDLLFELVIDEYYHDHLIKAKKYINLILKIALEYRYEDRSIEAIEKNLIMKYFSLIIEFKRGLLELDEINKVMEELKLFYNKSKSYKLEFYLLALEELLFIYENKEDGLKLKNLIINQKKLLEEFNYTNLEVYTLLYTYVDYMAFNHSFDDNEIIHKNNLNLYQDIYKFLNEHEYQDDLFILMYKREILFYMSKACDDKLKYMKEEYELAIKYFSDRHDEQSLKVLFNDTLYYKDLLLNLGMKNKALEVLKQASDQIDVLNMAKSKMLYMEKCILEAFIMKLMIEKDVRQAFNYVNPIFKYLKNLKPEEINFVLKAVFEALDLIVDIIQKDSNILYKKLYNKIYNELSKYCLDYMNSNGYKPYEINEEVMVVDENSSEEDLKKFMEMNIDKGVGFDDMYEELYADSDEPMVLTYRGKDPIDFEPIKNLRYTERYMNHYDKNVKANSEYEFWEAQIKKGYVLGFYKIGYIYEQQKQYQQAMSIYKAGASHGCIACLEGLGYLYHIHDMVQEAYDCLIKSAKGGYLPAAKMLLKNYYEILSHNNAYEDIMVCLYNNLVTYEQEYVNHETMELTKLCIELGELDPEEYPWFLKYYEFYTKIETGNLIKYLPAEINEYNKDEIEIFNIQRQAVVYENGDAMAELAYQYFSGKKINVDYQKGLNWTYRAFQKGNMRMCYYAAMLLYTGDSTLEIDYNNVTGLMLNAIRYDESIKEDGLMVLKYIYDHNLCDEKYMVHLKRLLNKE